MKKNHIDYFLLAITIFLLLFGILFLASVSAVFSQKKFGNPTYYLFHQILWGILPGIILGFIVFKTSLSYLKKWSWVFFLINLFLMILVFFPFFQIHRGGASRWLNFRIFTFQPSEILKISFIVYLSALLDNKVKKSYSKKRKNKNTSLFFIFLLIVGVVIFLLTCQSDLSTLGIILITGILIYFFSGTPFWQTAILLVLGGGAGLLLIKLFPYRLNRVLVWLNYIKDPMGIGYQLKQSLIAIGSGGIGRLALGMSQQKFGFIPQAMSDSIFAIIGEELGFIGSSLLIVVFLLFLWRGIKIARKRTDRFSQFLALGITFWIVIQAFTNIGAMIGLLPLTGIPLPFISYGGSHIVSELIGVGLLLNISKRQKK